MHNLSRALPGYIFSFLTLVLPLGVCGSSAIVWAEQVYSFTVKGVVKRLPQGQANGQRELLVKHEEIPEYRDRSGKVVGMMAMTMPFYLSQTLSLEGVAVGDAVELTVEQRIEPRFNEEVVALRKVQ
jgi:Cu/Ag efflux protein CusF